jgi:hypothetical protein
MSGQITSIVELPPWAFWTHDAYASEEEQQLAFRGMLPAWRINEIAHKISVERDKLYAMPVEVGDEFTPPSWRMN